MTAVQIVEMVIGAGGIGGAMKIIGQLTRIAVAIESIVEWRKATDAKLEDHQSRLDRGGL